MSMLLKGLGGMRSGWMYRQEGADSGGGVATEEAGDTGEPTERQDVGEDHDDQGVVEETDEGNLDEETPPEESSSDRQPPRTIPQHVPKARLDAVLARSKKTEEQVQALQAQLDALKPAEKDPIDAYMEGIPKGEEGSEERRRYEDAELILKNPIVKGALDRQGLQTRAVLAGVLQALDRVRFENDQLLETLVERDADGKIVKDRRPPGLKHLDRITKLREDTFRTSGGKTLIRHADAFAQVQETLREEEEARTTQERGIRIDERGRTIRETQQRRSASGAAGGAPAVRAPHGTSPRGRLTPQEIDRSGQDFLLP
jgi:hypothetical protein